MVEDLFDAQLKEKILNFVSRQTGHPQSNLTMSTSLLHDLRLDGEDAHSLIVNFNKEFNVNQSSFSFYAMCFNREGPWDFILLPLTLVRCVYLYLAKPESCKKIPLLIEDFYRAAKEGKWSIPADRTAKFPWEKGMLAKTSSSNI